MKMDFLSFDNENLFINFPPGLRENFEELFHQGSIGLSPFTLNDISFTKQYTDDNSTFCYYYTLKIPYAGKRLSWELIFDPEDMSFAPDFNFNDDHFHMSHDLGLIIENVPSLLNWNVNNPKALSSVLQEFLHLFKKQQIERLHKENVYSQLNTEYQKFLETGAVDDVEVYLENACAHLIINIKVDISTLPEYSQPKNEFLLNPGDDTCILKVSYMKLDGSRVNTTLQLSPRLEQVFGSVKLLHIPIYNKQTSLVDYVDLVKQLLQDQIKKVEMHYTLKKEYMNNLYTMYSEKIIELDSETFSKAVFLCEVEDYYCLVHVNIGTLFPQEKPTVVLHSLYCGKPCVEELKDYHYSPRWTPQLMLKRLRTYLVDVLPKFKTHLH